MKKLQLPNMPNLLKLGIFVLIAGLTFASCDTVSNSNGNNGHVSLQFQTVTSAANNGTTTAMAVQQSGNTLKVEGNNGTLLITDIHFIVDDFELEKADGECKGLEEEKEDACEEFEGGLFFVDLPLNNEPLNLTSSSIKNGVYAELEFEIDDLDLDEKEDSAEVRQKEALLAKVRTAYPDWPKSASMVISGTFESNSGAITEFTTYAEAEVSVEMDLTPPLEIKDGTGKQITVTISPAKWFTRSDGSVIDLAGFDFSITEKILEFEVEIENGFLSTEVEID